MASDLEGFRASQTHMDTTMEKVPAYVQNHKFAFLLSSLVLLLLLYPFLENETIGRHIFSILPGLILISGIIVVGETRMGLFIIVGISIPTIVLNVVRYLDPNPVWHYGYQIFAIVFFLLTAFVTTENYHTRLRESTAELLLNYIRNNINTTVTYKKKQYSYQYVLSDNIQMLANYIQDRQKELHFNVPGVPIKQNDDNATRDYIMNIRPSSGRSWALISRRCGISRKICGRARRSSYTIRSKLK